MRYLNLKHKVTGTNNLSFSLFFQPIISSTPFKAVFTEIKGTQLRN